MVQVPLKAKYRTATMAKKIGAGSNDSGKPRHRRRSPAPVSRLRTLHLVQGRKRRFEG